MKVVGVIPARYKSTRFPGKPLADICGKPMIYWVYQQVKQTKNIDEIFVATDDERILKVCEKLSLKCIMTEQTHPTGIDRAFEIAKKVSADFYVVINGDEPLIDPKVVERIVPTEDLQTDFYAANLMTEIQNPVEAIDFTNIKVVTDDQGNALFMSRSPIPYPKASMAYKYYKHVGVLIYNYNALKFFVNTPRGYNEKIEDINELRFIEHNKPLKMICVDSVSLSVDTPKDLEKVRKILSERLENPPPPYYHVDKQNYYITISFKLLLRFIFFLKCLEKLQGKGGVAYESYRRNSCAL